MSVEHFAQWILDNMPPFWSMPSGAVWKIEDVTSILLYRKEQFQVQMFIMPSNYIVPEHTHPNVDSVEIFMGGQIRFSHSGKWVNQDGEHFAIHPGMHIRVKPNDIHGANIGPDGGVFLSVQEWLNGVAPHCVAADYSGVVMGPDHFKKVIAGNPVLSERKIVARLEDAPSL